MSLALRRRLAYARAWVRGAAIEALHRPAPGGPPSGPGNGHGVVVDLRDTSIGRHLYSAVRAFHEAGYDVWTGVRPAYPRGHVEHKYSRLARTLPGGRLGRGRGAVPARTIYVTDRPDRVPNRPWRAVLPIDYDFYGAPEDAFTIPYPMHPLVYIRGEHKPSHLAALREAPRPIGVLFLGNDAAGSYSTGPVADVFGLTPRAPLLAKLGSLMTAVPPPPNIRAADGGTQRGTAADLIESATADQAVRADGWRISDEEFLRAVASAAFFIAAPGVTLPFSHNIVESMAVGTVPITEYGHMLRPALTDREAVLFSDGNMRAAVERALSMPESERVAMSKAAAAYYDDHLSGAAFGRRVEAAIATHVPSGPLYLHAGKATLRALKQRAQGM